MKWYRKLYIGENAKKDKYKVFGHIRKNRFCADTFLITLASNTCNILDIYSANMLLQPHFKNKNVNEEIYVVGLAKGRDEALNLVRDIIDEVYNATGGFDIRESLLGILILLVLMVLFVPVRYNISADYHSRLTANIKISWLLNVLRLKASYANDLSVKAYAMFFKIFDNNSDKEKKQKNKEGDKCIDDMYVADSSQETAGQYAAGRQNETSGAGNSQDTAVQVEALEAEKAVADKKIVADEALEKTDEKASRSSSKERLEEIHKKADIKQHIESRSNNQHNEDDKHNRQSVSQPHKKKDLIGRLKAALNSVKDKLISIKSKFKKLLKAIVDKKRSAWQKINDLKVIINDEENKELVRLIKKELKELIREITPVKYDVNVRYGCEEPYMTGRILGVIAVIYGITGVQFNITPEFEQKVLEVDIYMKGRVRIYRLLLIALRIYKNNRFRKLVLNKG